MDSTYYQQIQKLQKSIYTYLDPAQWENQVYQTPRSLLQKTGVFVMLFYTHSPIPAAKQKGEIPHTKATTKPSTLSQIKKDGDHDWQNHLTGKLCLNQVRGQQLTLPLPLPPPTSVTRKSLLWKAAWRRPDKSARI